MDIEVKNARILIVDDEPKNVDLLEKTLFRNGYQNLKSTTDSREALSIYKEYNPDLLLLDLLMPYLDGFAVLEQLKPFTQDFFPVMVLTAQSGDEACIKTLSSGATDFLSKPFNLLEVLIRVEKLLAIRLLNKQVREQNEALEKAVQERTQELVDANIKLNKLSRTDTLTSLPNRRDLSEKMEIELVRNERSKSTFSLIMGDIDNFKIINDTFGHDAGDYVLVGVAKIIAGAIRRQDTVARWGGEEFLILSPETDVDGGAKQAEKIRDYIEKEKFSYGQKNIVVTMSFGVSSSGVNLPLKEILMKSDNNLYEAKKSGKNKVVY
jgi:two-component system, cell cycle response regulator